jgi:hypothetical protein
VASPTEPFRQAIRDGVTGFLAFTAEEWYTVIDRLVTDHDLRQRIAQAAFYDVLWTYGPERRSELMMSLVEQVLHGGMRGARAFELDLARSSYSRPSAPTIPAHEILFRRDRLRPSAVTVIVPLHNYANYVEEALASVGAQTLADLDLVVVDDASTDDSFEVARNWLEGNERRFNRVILAKTTVNSGLGLARNVGFALAETRYVLPLDADNQLLPCCAERCLATLHTSTAAFAYPLIQKFGDEDDTMRVFAYQPARFTFGNYIDAMALIRKAAWATAGGYTGACAGWEDYDLWCKFVERGLYGVQVPEKLARYRVHQDSMLRVTPPRVRAQTVDEIKRCHPWLTVEEAPLNQMSVPVQTERWVAKVGRSQRAP